MHGAGGPCSGSNGRGGGWLQVGERGLAEYLTFPSPFALFKLRFIWVQKWRRRGLGSRSGHTPRQMEAAFSKGSACERGFESGVKAAEQLGITP